ncbi:hypothetical protein PHMEG_0002520 [Phytophthora megakarya]|uniref:Uncharacterized protein n=1 Tax=Phytophthora megakarya TaxID=4795 RepID=A0A225WY70_9STRA|nr:hypothetical protein PHMEG_0002520 [Phytophthora megakarya]
MSRCYAVASDQDVDVSIPQPIFEVIRPPEEHAAQIELHYEWQRYVKKIPAVLRKVRRLKNVVETVKSLVQLKVL